MASSLPAWVIDERESLRREAEFYRNLDDRQRLELLAAACRAAARMLRLRDDPEKVLEHSDPLPESTARALKRLREEARTRTRSRESRHD